MKTQKQEEQTKIEKLHCHGCHITGCIGMTVVFPDIAQVRKAEREKTLLELFKEFELDDGGEYIETKMIRDYIKETIAEQEEFLKTE